MGISIAPMKVQVPQAVLDDLRQRLEHTRWPQSFPDMGWDYGTNTEYMKELVDYWLNRFDWRKQEERINQYPHFAGPSGRYRRSFHAHSRQGAESNAIADDAWLSMVVVDPAENCPPADRPGRPRRPGGGRLCPDHSVVMRILPLRPGAAPQFRLPGPSRRLPADHARPGLQEVRHPGRRLGRNHHLSLGASVPGGPDRHPYQLYGQPHGR